MLLPKGTIVVVADGEKFNLFSNTGDEAGPTLTAMADFSNRVLSAHGEGVEVSK